MSDLKHVQVSVGIPADEDLLGVITIRRTPRGTLAATGSPLPGHALPPATPGLLRWLADAFEIEMLAEAVPDAP